MTFVRTVLGDVQPTELGTVDYHEHLFQVSPLLRGDELADESRSGAEAASLHDGGIATMVEATPRGLGADPAAVARISQDTGLKIVHATGTHRAAHYTEGDAILAATETRLADRFVTDVQEGFESTRADPVRAGVVKAGAEYWSLPAFTRRGLAAAATAHRRTGVPLMVHLEHGSAGHEVLDILEHDGVRLTQVALAHIDRNPDPELHMSLAARGAKLGYDGWARHREWPDSVLLDCLERVVADDSGARAVMLGGDVARASRYRAYGGIPGLDYLPIRVLPRVRERLGSELTRSVTAHNPAEWLTFTEPRES